MRRLLVIIAAACAAVVPSAGMAATSSSCGAAVLKDWSDGKLNHAYPVRCYQDALDRMPEDMRSYTSAPDDIQRALLARLRQGRTNGAGDRQSGARREALSAAGIDEVARSTGIPRPLVALGVIGIALVAAGSGGLVARLLKARADT
jgi:hypothetical protein